MKADGMVYVVGSGGRSALVKDGDEIPDWAEGLGDTEPETPEPETPEPETPEPETPEPETPAPVPPPKSGKNGTTVKWAEYAREVGVEVPDGAKQGEIIAAIAAAGKPVD